MTPKKHGVKTWETEIHNHHQHMSSNSMLEPLCQAWYVNLTGNSENWDLETLSKLSKTEVHTQSVSFWHSPLRYHIPYFFQVRSGRKDQNKGGQLGPRMAHRKDGRTWTTVEWRQWDWKRTRDTQGRGARALDPWLDVEETGGYW